MTPIVQQLIAASQLAVDVFVFYLQDERGTGELTIGSTDATKYGFTHYTADVLYAAVTSDTYWEVALTSIAAAVCHVGLVHCRLKAKIHLRRIFKNRSEIDELTLVYY